MGDPDHNEVVIKNSTGQGTNWAPAACSLTMGQAIMEESHRHKESRMKVGDLEIDPLMFVDDNAILHDNVNGAKAGGNVVTEAFDELGLEAHPEKSKQVIMGSKKLTERVRDDLQEEPVKVQGWDMGESECETYLGSEVSSKGVRDSVTRSIKKRCRAATAKVVQLNKLLDNDLMQRVGWLDAAKTLFNSIIVSTITYATEAYAFMTKAQIAEIEACVKNLLYMMLRISKFTQYAGVLHECNMIRVKHTINKLKINFVNSLIHDKASGTCLKVLRKEEEMYPGTGLLAEVSQLCEMYGIEDVTTVKVDKKIVKETIWDFGRNEVWMETLGNRKIPYSANHQSRYRLYGQLPRDQAKLFLAYKTGGLRFKNESKGEFLKRFGDLKCFIKGCNGLDTLEHVKNCRGYRSKYVGPGWEWEDLQSINKTVSYLVDLNRERQIRFNCPLIYKPGLKELCNT